LHAARASIWRTDPSRSIRIAQTFFSIGAVLSRHFAAGMTTEMMTAGGGRH
jgi:hypothetical protein